MLNYHMTRVPMWGRWPGVMRMEKALSTFDSLKYDINIPLITQSMFRSCGLDVEYINILRY